MDRLADYELTTLLDCIDYAYVEEWQQSRILLWAIIKTRAGKGWNKKPTDLIPLVIDGKDKYKTADELDDEEVDNIKKIFAMFGKQPPKEQNYESIDLNG